MILTGNEIANEYYTNKIVIDPFLKENVNPNSYNFRLDRVLKEYSGNVLDPKKVNNSRDLYIPDEGFELNPHQLYLANTIERLGSDYYVPTYNARSSIARLGLFINLSATLLDIGFKGQITMQLYSVHRLKVYYGMSIGQIMFWVPKGKISLYHGKYQSSAGVQTTKIYQDFEEENKSNEK